MIFDYATLKRDLVVHSSAIIIVAFALTDGWDLGIGMLSPLLGKTDDERRVILRSIEPNWEGNQTWFVIAGGVIFAAWPLVYAAAFSGHVRGDAARAVRTVLPAGGLQVPQQGRKPALAAQRGTADCSSAASCRHSCSASRSATCCSVFRSSSTVTCGCFTRALSGACSIRSRCLRAWSAWPC